MEYTGKVISEIEVKLFPSNIRNKEGIEKVKKGIVQEGIAHEGDLVLVEMLSEEGAITGIENLNCELVEMTPGDKFIGTVCIRDSGVSLVGTVPDEGMKAPGKADILTNAGGVGVCTAYPSLSTKVKAMPAANVNILGVIHNEAGEIINLKHLISKPVSEELSPIIFVLGTSSECGKTTASKNIINHLSKKLRVGGVKISGTGRLRDINQLRVNGATNIADFVDFGMPSTYGDTNKTVEAAWNALKAASVDTDIIVSEAGGDLIWSGIPELLNQPEVRERVALVVLSANDALGAHSGLHFLKEWGYKDVIVCGPVCNIESGIRRVKKVTNLEGYDIHSEDGLEQFYAAVEKHIK